MASSNVDKNGLLAELSAHSLSDIVSMGFSFIGTVLFYRGARLIRRPFHIRNKKNFHYGPGFTTGHNCRIELFGDGIIKAGKNFLIGDNVHIASLGLVEIGDDCLFASKIYISDISHGSVGPDGEAPTVPPNDRTLTSKPIHIGDRVWIGESVVVLPGVTIGDGCIIGANATVTKDIPADCVAIGSPAKPFKHFNYETAEWERI